MSKIVKPTDFIGKYSISQNSFDVIKLQAFIDKYEKKYLYDLLGVTLGDLLYTDIVGVTFLPPPTVIYATIFNPLNSDTNNIRSNGIKEMLLGFIYWEYCIQNLIKNTPTGFVVAANEVSNAIDWNSTPIYSNYNESVETYRDIQIYVYNNSIDYPDYKGTHKSINHWSI
jgi:hypothetical protein